MDEGTHLAHADVTPDEAVNPRQGQRNDLYENYIGKLNKRVEKFLLRNDELESNEVGDEETGRQDQEIQDELSLPRQKAERNIQVAKQGIPPSLDLRRTGGFSFPYGPYWTRNRRSLL